MQHKLFEIKDIQIAVPFITDPKEDIKYAKKEYKKDWEFFRENFLFIVSYNQFMNREIMETFPLLISSMLVEGLDESDRKYYNIDF